MRRAARERLVADLSIPGWEQWPKMIQAVDHLLDDVGEKVVARWRVEVLYEQMLREGHTEVAMELKKILDA